jgi:hypothetical protein
VTEQPYTEPGLTEETRKEIMAEIDRQIAHEQNGALSAHHRALMAIIDQIIDGRKTFTESWLVRQLKNMRTDMVLSGRDHEADVLTQAITQLGGKL